MPVRVLRIHARAVCMTRPSSCCGGCCRLTPSLLPALLPASLLPAPSPAGGKGTATDKIAALEAAGVRVTTSPAQMGTTMTALMRERGLL